MPFGSFAQTPVRKHTPFERTDFFLKEFQALNERDKKSPTGVFQFNRLQTEARKAFGSDFDARSLFNGINPSVSSGGATRAPAGGGGGGSAGGSPFAGQPFGMAGTFDANGNFIPSGSGPSGGGTSGGGSQTPNINGSPTFSTPTTIGDTNLFEQAFANVNATGTGQREEINRSFNQALAFNQAHLQESGLFDSSQPQRLVNRNVIDRTFALNNLEGALANQRNNILLGKAGFDEGQRQFNAALGADLTRSAAGAVPQSSIPSAPQVPNISDILGLVDAILGRSGPTGGGGSGAGSGTGSGVGTGSDTGSGAGSSGGVDQGGVIDDVLGGIFNVDDLRRQLASTPEGSERLAVLDRRGLGQSILNLQTALSFVN